MTWLYNLKTMKKLMLAFGLTLTALLTVGYFGISGMAEIAENMRDIYNKHLLGVSYIKEANINLVYIGRAARQAVIDTDQALMEQTPPRSPRTKHFYVKTSENSPTRLWLPKLKRS